MQARLEQASSGLKAIGHRAVYFDWRRIFGRTVMTSTVLGIILEVVNQCIVLGSTAALSVEQF